MAIIFKLLRMFYFWGQIQPCFGKKNTTMTSLTIHPNTTLAEIQTNFHTQFPFLKLEFFHHAHQPHQGSEKKDMITDAHIKVGSLTTAAMEVTWQIDPDATIEELEKFFEQKLHLHVQVFYKSHKIWLETLRADTLTLEHLNKRTAEFHAEIISPEEPGDYHEQE